MVCPNCGYNIQNGKHKCARCGYSIEPYEEYDNIYETEYKEINPDDVLYGRVSNGRGGGGGGGLFENLFGGFGSFGGFGGSIFDSIGGIFGNIFGDVFEDEEEDDFDDTLYYIDALGDKVPKKITLIEINEVEILDENDQPIKKNKTKNNKNDTKK